MNLLHGKKYVWSLPAENTALELQIATHYNVMIPIAQTLLNRGYCDKEAIESFLFGSQAQPHAHPSLLKDAQRAVDRIIKAINNQEQILIFGDYDVDGITSASLMLLSLKALGAQVNFFLPHRVRDGYGLSTNIVKRAARNKYGLIITVDNGITAFDAVACAKDLGMDVIITDHHQPHTSLPDAYAIVNPHQAECAYPFKYFAGVGVTFKLISLLYEHYNRVMPKKAFELLLLGTIADVVPLVGENRFLVRQALTTVNNHDSYALQVLRKNGNVTKKNLSSLDIGYSIAPQINALGRLEDPRQGVKFLIGNDQQEIDAIGNILHSLNQTRKDLERDIIQEIVYQIEHDAINLKKDNLIIAAHRQWPPGVIGLVASRLVGLYGKPAILLHIGSDGKAKGSCRSISALNMFEALSSCADILDSFGGHAFAAGLSLSVDKIHVLKERLEDFIASHVKPEDFQQRLSLDAKLTLTEVNHKLMNDLEYLEPFGNQNNPPSFFIPRVTSIQEPMLLKNEHVKCSMFAEGVIKPVIFFNRPDIYSVLKEHQSKQFALAAQVSENSWQGKTSIELRGVDIACLDD